MKKIKIVTLVGARPQFIKAAAISREIRVHYPGRVEELIVHSGQHYDENMSEVFFREMEIPVPAFNLSVGSGSHGAMTAGIIRGTEEVLQSVRPDAVVVYGDTNTTLAGAVAAVKLHIPVVHIEAGLRSFNKSMPEEINRILCDHASTFLFTPTPTGMKNLAAEGFKLDSTAPYSADNPAVVHTGDVMFDNALHYLEKAKAKSTVMAENKIAGDFVLCTIHRDGNTDDTARLSGIFEALDRISRAFSTSVVIPLHPRTAKMMPRMLEPALMERITKNERIRLISPVSYFDMLILESRADLVITDSGGVQKEAYFFRKPSLILRRESEWKEIIEHGAALIVDADTAGIEAGFAKMKNSPPEIFPSVFGDGKSAGTILKFITNNL
jgi:UDP-GlcNAc3NAcA epimerase